MALAKDVMGGGFSAGQAAALNGTVNSAVTAAGTTQGTATALTASNNFVSTATADQGVQVPNAVIGDSVEIYNGTTVNIKVYPPTSGTINQLAANSGFNLPSRTLCQVQKWTSTVWVATISA